MLKLLASGASSTEMADELAISPDTVRTLVQNILAKLQVHPRLEAAAMSNRKEGVEMAATQAIVAASPGSAQLHHFNDEIVVKMELADEGKWILMSRVTLVSSDSDRQWATAKLVHGAKVIKEESNYIDFLDPICIYFQIGFVANGKETITLECNSYKGVGLQASIVALKVDDIDFQ